MDEDREKIIERALKLRELANRGVGGEKQNAIRMLAEHKEKHSLTDEDLNLFTFSDSEYYSNLTPEERTGSFAKWFGKSHAYCDAKPMVFYHKSRTVEPFTVFSHELGYRYYPNNYGFHFVHEEDQKYVQHIGNTHLGRGVDFKVYLKMMNPYYLYQRMNGESYGQNGEQYRPIEVNKSLYEWIASMGFDSIVMQCENGINVYVVFNPNQIKSITNTEFSDSDDINL